MKHLSLVVILLFAAGHAIAQDPWQTVTPADFHGTWEIRLDQIDWTRALADIPEKWRKEAREEVEKDLAANEPTLKFTVEHVWFNGKKRRDEDGEAAWKQLDPTTIELWVKGQSSPMKLRKQNGRCYATRRGLELPLTRPGARTNAKPPRPKAIPDLYAPLVAKAKHGDLNAAAKLVALGRWADVGSIEPSSVRAWSTIDKQVGGMTARQVYACVLANHAIRHRSEYGDRLDDAMEKARHDLDRAPTTHPMVAMDLAWLLSDFAPKDTKRAAMLRSWALDKLTAENSDQDAATRAHWLSTAAQLYEKRGEWDLAYPLFAKATKLFVEAKDVRGEFAAIRGHARNLGRQPNAKQPNERDRQTSRLYASVGKRIDADPHHAVHLGVEFAHFFEQDRWRAMLRAKDWKPYLNLLIASRAAAAPAGPKLRRFALGQLAAGYALIARDYSTRGDARQHRRYARLAANHFGELAKVLEAGSPDRTAITRIQTHWARIASGSKNAKPSVVLPIWYTNFRTASREAKRTNKIILANFSGSDWCDWCVKLKREVFARGDFERWAQENVVLLEVDFPQKKKQDAATRRQNRRLQEKHAIKGYPTLVFLDAEGKELGRLGYVRGGPAKWIAAAERILAGD